MLIKEQYDEGVRHGRADARIESKEGKLNRYMNVNNLNHKHDDFIYGYCLGFVLQRQKMRLQGELIPKRTDVEDIA